jgi:serine/threonine protein kinase/WD40 repeat protein/Flp pilus assembly protein TadD
MPESTSESDRFNELAYEFAERLRQGERPSLTEYTQRHPELAEDIRDLFPTLVMMEQLPSGDDHLSARNKVRPQTGRPLPERLGDYRILREIGRGGMGVVYEAEQESLRRHVALKVMGQQRNMDPVQLLRFQREARAAALLHHTNIVPVFGVGVHEGVHYYAMQYIHGRGLDAVLRQVIRLRGEGVAVQPSPRGDCDNISARLADGLLTHQFWSPPARADDHTGGRAPSAVQGSQSTVSWRQDLDASQTGGPQTGGPQTGGMQFGGSSSLSALGRKEQNYYRSIARLGMQAAEALAHAHTHGLVHRDIKPANLLLDLDGTVWVTDFGLAKSEGAEELTSPGDVVGTLRYMAPERFRGEAGPQCDIYSLGVSLYELLTLRPAFSGSHRLQLVAAIMESEPARPRKLDRQIPRDLETIVLKAIARSPAHRFSSAGELARELGRFVDRRPIRSRRASLPEQLWRWSRRNPAVAMLTVLAALLTTALAISATRAAWTYRVQRDAVRAEQRNTQVQLARSLLQQVRAERYSRQPGPREQRLDSLAKAARLARAGMAGSDLLTELRGEAIATLGEGDLRPSTTWRGLNYDPSFSSFSFDADRYVVLQGGHTFRLLRLSDGSEIRVLRTGSVSPLSFPELDPSGRFVHVRSGGSRTELWDLERGERPALWPTDVSGAAYRADGAQIAALRRDGEVHVFSLPEMKEVRRCALKEQFPTLLLRQQMALSRDGHSLAVMRMGTQDVWLFELDSGRSVIHLRVPPVTRSASLALGPKGTIVAVSHDRTLSVYDLADGERLAMLQGHQGSGIYATFEPEGDLLSTQCWDGFTRLWDPIRGRLLATLPGSVRGWVGARSRLVIGRRDDLILYQVDSGVERRTVDCRTLRERGDSAVYGPEGVSFSPDGTLLAIALRPDGVRIVRAADGTGVAHLPIDRCNAVLFLPEGALLTYNREGLCRWPVHYASNHLLEVGPPEPMAPNYSGWIPRGLASSAGGTLIGISSESLAGSLLLDLEQPWRRIWLHRHVGVYDVAISPDGRWVATAGSEGGPGNERVKIWDTATGAKRAELPGLSCVAFSTDGQLLGIDDRSSYRFFRTGTWTPEFKFDYQVEKTANQGSMRVAFHPVSGIAAILEGDLMTVSLVDLRRGRVLASIEGSDESQVHCLVFSPDGRFLAVAHNNQKVDLLELSLIRRRLQVLGLAAGFPDIFDSGTRANELPSVPRIVVKGADPAGLRLLSVRRTLREAAFDILRLFDGHVTDSIELYLRAYQWTNLGQWQRAASDFRKAAELDPESATSANELAWCLVSEPGRGNTEEAIRSARRAVTLAPNETNYRNTLAAALFRAGSYREAVVELERNIAENSRSIGDDWVFLAMCRARLGQLEAARVALANAKAWRPPSNLVNPVQQAQRARLIREAESILESALPDLPASVFAR